MPRKRLEKCDCHLMAICAWFCAITPFVSWIAFGTREGFLESCLIKPNKDLLLKLGLEETAWAFQATVWTCVFQSDLELRLSTCCRAASRKFLNVIRLATCLSRVCPVTESWKEHWDSSLWKK